MAEQDCNCYSVRRLQTVVCFLEYQCTNLLSKLQPKTTKNDNQSCQKIGSEGGLADLDFAQQVRDRRRQEGFSQAVLAEQVGISRNYLSQIERGRATNLSWQVRQRLVSLLGIGANDSPQQQRKAPLPEGLEAFAAKAQLPEDDVLMLAGLKYRGKQPTTADKWELLYNVIKMTVDS